MNTNGLKDFRCPTCHATDAFRIQARIMLLVTDDGTDYDEDGETEWSPASYCECVACAHHGIVSQFRPRGAR